MTSSDLDPLAHARQRATRLVFLLAGIAAAVWAALVPLVKARAALDDAQLGVLLLCLGGGSICAMPAAGALSTRYGCRVVIVAAALLASAALPALALLSTPWALAVALFAFGVGLGAADCVMNVQAVIVERDAARPLMSGFHGWYSLGGIVGALAASALMTLGLAPFAAALVTVGAMLVMLLLAAPALLPYGNPREGPAFAIPRGAVLLIGLLCFAVFLAEGAMMDWSAVLLSERHGLPTASAALGFASFSLTMTIGRLCGDRIVARIGHTPVIAVGGTLAAVGLALAALVPSPGVALLGHALIGAGCSNIVPVLFTATGRQTRMPQSIAIPAVTTLGYAGILAGPAAIGFIAAHSSLPVAFLVIAASMLLVACSARALRY